MSEYINNLKFLRDMLKRGDLYCEYCNKGPLRIYGKGDFRPIDGATCGHKTPISSGHQYLPKFLGDDISFTSQ